MGIDAIGIDNFPRSVELAEKRGLTVLLGDVNSPELSRLEFDAIVLQSVLEHVHDPVELLQRLGQRLRPGGILVVSAPTPCADFWNDPTHVRPFTPASFATMGELLGFETVRNTYVFSYLLGLNLRSAFWYKMINLIPVSLGSNLIAFYRKPLTQPIPGGS
jgi:2-polyprenyl-3-methyl-5-hydroxy-6-metoxy-1,4-benzoquinol methylase